MQKGWGFHCKWLSWWASQHVVTITCWQAKDDCTLYGGGICLKPKTRAQFRRLTTLIPFPPEPSTLANSAITAQEIVKGWLATWTRHTCQKPRGILSPFHSSSDSSDSVTLHTSLWHPLASRSLNGDTVLGTPFSKSQPRSCTSHLDCQVCYAYHAKEGIQGPAFKVLTGERAEQLGSLYLQRHQGTTMRSLSKYLRIWYFLPIIFARVWAQDLYPYSVTWRDPDRPPVNVLV